MKNLFNLSLLIPVLALTVAVIAAPLPRYKLLKKHVIGGTGGWDYISVDAIRHRLYVSHGTQVVVLDEVSGDSVGNIANTNGVHGIAIVSPLGKGYTSNGRSNTSSVFNLVDNKVIAEIKTGENPDAIFYDEYSKKLFVFNGRSKDATVIDPATEKVLATIPLGGKPEAGVSDGKGRVFVNIEDRNEVVVIDAAKLKVEKRFKLGGGEEPAGLAMDRSTSRLFVGCSNKLMVVLDAHTGKVIAKLPIGDGSDGVAFDPALKLAFSSNGEGSLTVVRELSADKFAVVQTVKTEARGRTLALDPRTHHIFIPTADFKEVSSTVDKPTTRPQAVPGSFRVLEIGQEELRTGNKN
jgi:YVTN family beta-propeller protein